MKVFRIEKSISIAAVVVILICVTVWAANIILISQSSHSSDIPTYNQIPSAEILQRDIGILANIKNSYSNGYTFKSGHIAENINVFDNNETQSYKGLACVYEKDSQELCVFIEPLLVVKEKIADQSSINYNNCDLVYYSYQNKIVPSDYIMTEQDKKDEESGKYVFSYGSDEVSIFYVQIVVWTNNGINFEIIDNAKAVSKDEIIQMARETIDYQ